jgi:hypothetical protein
VDKGSFASTRAPVASSDGICLISTSSFGFNRFGSEVQLDDAKAFPFDLVAEMHFTTRNRTMHSDSWSTSDVSRSVTGNPPVGTQSMPTRRAHDDTDDCRHDSRICCNSSNAVASAKIYCDRGALVEESIDWRHFELDSIPPTNDGATVARCGVPWTMTTDVDDAAPTLAMDVVAAPTVGHARWSAHRIAAAAWAATARCGDQASGLLSVVAAVGLADVASRRGGGVPAAARIVAAVVMHAWPSIASHVVVETPGVDEEEETGENLILFFSKPGGAECLEF